MLLVSFGKVLLGVKHKLLFIKLPKTQKIIKKN